jgi:hypothetical protein
LPGLALRLGFLFVCVAAVVDFLDEGGGVFEVELDDYSKVSLSDSVKAGPFSLELFNIDVCLFSSKLLYGTFDEIKNFPAGKFMFLQEFFCAITEINCPLMHLLCSLLLSFGRVCRSVFRCLFALRRIRQGPRALLTSLVPFSWLRGLLRVLRSLFFLR